MAFVDRLSLRAAFAGAVLIAAVAAASAAAAAPLPAAGRIVVLTPADRPPLGTGTFVGDRAVTGAADLDRLCRDLGVVGVEPFYPGVLRRPGLARLADRLRVLRLAPDADPSDAVARLAADPRIESAEVPVPARLLYTPDDPLYPQQWALPHVRAPEAWNVVRDPDTRATVVGLIDTGLDLDDPDLAPSVWVNELEDLDHDGRLGPGDLDGVDQDGNGFVDDVVGWDFADADPDPQETHAHGSAVGACVSAATDNGLGIAAIGFGVRLMVLKGIADGGFLADGYTPMLYAADNGAAVINCSWGVPVFQAYEQAIVDAVWAEDVVLVAAGGDGAQVVYPAGYDHVVGVSATDPSDRRAPFAPFGPTVDICAPGVDILTIWDGSPTIVSGTSFASGMVAGLTGLVRAVDPTATAAGVVSLIESTAVDIDALNPGYEGQLGAGRIDAFLAVATSVTGANPAAAGARAELNLRCTPNPAAGGTTVRFDLARPGSVDLSVFDVRGRRVAVLARGEHPAGPHAVTWRTGDAASGVYFVRLTSGGESAVGSVSVLH